MDHFVYMIKTINSKVNKTYVGYSTNPKKRLKQHNLHIGAKSTKGHKWKIIYSRKYKSKIKAMREEYKLKKNYQLRKIIKNKYLRNA